MRAGQVLLSQSHPSSSFSIPTAIVSALEVEQIS